MNKLNETTVTFILIFNDGERIVENVKLADVNGRWAKACREFGGRHRITSEYWSTLVIVCGHQVNTYRDGEVREILLGI